jgi:hypothetical protein
MRKTRRKQKLRKKPGRKTKSERKTQRKQKTYKKTYKKNKKRLTQRKKGGVYIENYDGDADVVAGEPPSASKAASKAATTGVQQLVDVWLPPRENAATKVQAIQRGIIARRAAADKAEAAADKAEAAELTENMFNTYTELEIMNGNRVRGEHFEEKKKQLFNLINKNMERVEARKTGVGEGVRVKAAKLLSHIENEREARLRRPVPEARLHRPVHKDEEAAAAAAARAAEEDAERQASEAAERQQEANMAIKMWGKGGCRSNKRR